MRSDDDLMQAAQQGDMAAFDELLRCYYSSLRQLAAGLLPVQPVVDADDVAVESFLRAWERSGTFCPGRGTVWNWLQGIAVNCCREVARRERRREQSLVSKSERRHPAWLPPASSLSLTMEDPAADSDSQLPALVSPSAESTYLACLDAQERQQQVREWLSWLTPTEREAVVLWALQDMTCPQVAAVLGLKVKTVQRRVERGLERIRTRLNGAAPAGAIRGGNRL